MEFFYKSEMNGVLVLSLLRSFKIRLATLLLPMACVFFQSIFFALSVHADIPRGLVHYFQSNRHLYSGSLVPIAYNYGSEKYKRTSILAENCYELNDFSDKFIKWALSFPDHSFKSKPVCECEDSVCHIELTDYFPSFVREKISREITCHGPNCANTSLIARGFLEPTQIRYTNEEEFKYYLNRFCEVIPTDSVDTNDIISYSNRDGILSMHAGIYIGHNYVFSKAGPLRVNFYSLEDWSYKFTHEKRHLKVFRCKRVANKEINSILWELERAYTHLVDSDLAPNELDAQLSALDLQLSNFDRSLLISEADHVSFESLKTSVYQSKTPLVNLLLDNGERQCVERDSIKSVFKNPEDTLPVPCDHSLKVGDYVELENYMTYNSQYFKSGKKYKVLHVL